MYSVVLVEDEDIIRKGIRYSVPWEEHGYVGWGKPCTVLKERS